MSSMSMVKRLATKPPGSTAFQLHKSQLELSLDAVQKVLDLTEYKLLLLVRSSQDNERKLALLDLLSRYRKGDVIVGWESGSKPVYTHRDRDTRK